MAGADKPAQPVTLFYSYAHEDEPLRNELQGHLKILERRGLLAPWSDRRISAGQDWAEQIDANLCDAELVLLLISKDFIDSDYIMSVELAAAMRRHAQQRSVVVPIMVRAVDVDPEDDADLMPFLRLQGLPTDLRPVTSWPNRDEAWTNVAKGLRVMVKEIQQRRAQLAAQPAPPSPCGPAGAMTEARPDAVAAPAPAGATPAPDPLLEHVIADVTQQIGQAQSERNQPPLNRSGIARLNEGTRALIDVPDQKRVLWVDDKPQANRFEVSVLAKLQIEVVAVVSTDEALQRIEQDTEEFDLVVSDWERDSEPPEAGLRLLQRLRSAGFQVPLIYYHSAEGAERARRAALARAAGAFGEATLPIQLMTLMVKALGAGLPCA